LTAWNIEEWNIAFSQGSEPGTWKWTVHLTIRRPKSGQTDIGRLEAVAAAKLVIDKALDPKRRRLIPPRRDD